MVNAIIVSIIFVILITMYLRKKIDYIQLILLLLNILTIYTVVELHHKINMLI